MFIILAIINLIGTIWCGAAFAHDPKPVYLIVGGFSAFVAGRCISRSLDR